MDTENVAVHAISMPNQVFLVGGLGPGSPTPWLALTAPRVMVPDLEGRYTAYAIEGIEEVLRVHPGAAWAGLSGEPGCALLEAWRTAVGDVDVPPGDLDPSAPGTCVALPSLNLTSGSLLVGTWGTTDEQRAEGLIALTDVLTVAPLPGEERRWRCSSVPGLRGRGVSVPFKNVLGYARPDARVLRLYEATLS